MKSYIYLVLLLMLLCVIFVFSNQSGDTSGSLSESITTEVLETLYTDFDTLNEDAKKTLVLDYNYFVRKCAHITEYFILTFLAYNTFIGFFKKNLIKITLLFSVFIAISDEIHQLFIPGRSGRVTDVLIDSIGIFSMILIIILYKKYRNRRESIC